MTPREFHALARRRQQVRERSQQHLELLFAINTANTVNTSFCRPEKAAKIEDFLLRPIAGLNAAEAEPVTAGDAIRAMLAGLPAGFVRQG